MEFRKYEGQNLKTGDMVICGNGGLAVICSGLTTGEPTRIDSVVSFEKSAWSAELECLDKSGVMKSLTGDVFDCLLMHMAVEIPTKRFCGDCGRDVVAEIYNDKVTPALTVCSMCGQFCNEQ